MKPILKIFAKMLLVASFSLPAFAQKNKSMANASEGPRKHLSTIVFAGVAGAVLGLSTLSFYGRPQEKLSHIAIGAAIGIIGGAMYTTFKAATEPKDFYSLRESGPNPEFWSLAQTSPVSPAPKASFAFEF